MSNVSARELVSVDKGKGDIRFLAIISTLTRGGQSVQTTVGARERGQITLRLL